MSQSKSPVPQTVAFGFLIAGTHSGVGKTTVTLGIMARLRAGPGGAALQGRAGFIDATHHTAVCGRPSRSLASLHDGVEGVRRSFAGALQG